MCAHQLRFIYILLYYRVIFPWIELTALREYYLPTSDPGKIQDLSSMHEFQEEVHYVPGMRRKRYWSFDDPFGGEQSP